jgi:acetyltransferase-like isoleucine patch superfamily enzyme
MNWRILLQKLAARPTCECGARVIFSSSARILNASRSSSTIRIGDDSVISGELFVFAHGGSIRIGKWCFIGPGTRVWSAGQVNIGDRVLISHNVNVFDSLTHPLSPAKRHAQFRAIVTAGHPQAIDLGERAVSIGDDAWIGTGATILRGVSIGARAVIGAGSVVTTNIPEESIASGNPAVVRRRLTVEELSST